jgi:hypothetical protein
MPKIHNPNFYFQASFFMAQNNKACNFSVPLSARDFGGGGCDENWALSAT